MNKHIFAAGILGLASLHGQVLSNNELFQKLSTFSNSVLDEGFGNRVVKGKPFSATEERHSLQVLGDGTRIENTETNRLYRDADGRTRREQMNGTVNIYDPVARLRVELDPATKTAQKGTAGTIFFANSGTTFLTNGWPSLGPTARTDPATMKGVMSETTENLGSQSVNGVTAQGVRTTMIIPKGQIGNNRDIKVMTERWTSNDLQMLVKSVNSDPRFGETTYQLTKVVQSPPDAGLFQIPPDYTITDKLKQTLKVKEAVKDAVKDALKALPALPPNPPVPPSKQ